MELYRYKDKIYPGYLKTGNASQHILATAKLFCEGKGLDVGGGAWPFPGAVVVDAKTGGDAMELPCDDWDFIFSSHCLEHLLDPIAALRHWINMLVPGGVLFLYLPHPDMEYWLPQNCEKHRHSWSPSQMVKIVEDLGLRWILNSERDLGWGFSVVGYKPHG